MQYILKGSYRGVPVGLAPAIKLDLIDRGFNSIQKLLIMYNLATGKQYTMIGWDFTSPKILPSSSDRNTSTYVVNTIPNEGLFSPQEVQYNRIHVSNLGSNIFQKGIAVNVSDLLTIINKRYSTFITADDIVDAVLPSANSSGNVVVNIVFISDHLQFYSSPIITISNLSVAQVVTKVSLGLDRVNNTSDVEKPLSLATSQALDANSVASHTELTAAVAVINTRLTADEAATPAPSGAVCLWTTSDW